MDTLGKYMAEQVAKQASIAQRIARMREQNRAASPIANIGQAAGQAVRNAVASVPAPAPSSGWGNLGQSVGQSIARAAVESAAPAPPPTIGQRIAEQIVSQAASARQQVAMPAVASTGPVPLRGMTAQDAPEAWQTWQSPEGDRVVMPTTYTPPETWTPMGDPLTDPERIQNAQQSPLAYDNQPPEIQSQITVPDAPVLRGMTVSPYGDEMARLQAPGLASSIGRQAERQANRTLDQTLTPDVNDDITRGGTVRRGDATTAQNLIRSRTAASSSPFVRVRAGRTGEEYVIPRERAGNLGPGDVILGPAETQPESDRDRGAAGTDFIDNATRVAGDLWSIVKYGGNEIVEADSPVGEFVRTARDEGWDAAFKSVIPDYMDWIDKPRVTSTNNAIDAYIKLKTGNYDPREEPDLLADAASLTTGFLTEAAQRQVMGLTSVVIPTSPEYGITTGGDVTFTDWYNDTSTVIYADGSTANVYTRDIEANPDAFAEAQVIANEERANIAYTEGIDTDGDGEADVVGADAVRQMYEADASGLATFVYQVGMDPLTYIPLVTVGGAKLRNLGRARAVASVTPGGARANRVIQGVGTTIQRIGQAVDEGTSFGAGIILDKALMPATRRVGEWLRIASESNASRQLTDPAEVGSVGVGISRRADGSSPPPVTRRGDPRSVDGTTPASVTRRASTPPQEPAAIADPRTPGSEPRLSETRPPARTSRPTENLDPGPDLRTPDGGSVPTRVADGEGGVIVREVNEEGGIVPVAREGSTHPPRPLRTASGTVDASGIPPRYDAPIRRSAAVNGPDITQAATDTMRAGGRFIDNTATSRAIGDALGTNAGTVDHALNTSAFADEWNAALVDAGGQRIPYTRSSQSSREFLAAERVIHQPWGATTRERSILYHLPAENENAMRRAVPATPTPADLAAAERYADLVDTHRFWNPQDVTDPDFQRAMKQADDIRTRLAQEEYAGRPTGNIRRGSLIGGGDRPPVATSTVDTPNAPRTGGDSGFASSGQVRKVLLDGESEFGEVGGYPVINERQGGPRGDLYQTVRLDEDTVVIVNPVREADVPAAVKTQYGQQPAWFRAMLDDESVAFEEVVRYAPDADTAVRQVAEEAQARGLVNAEAPAAQAVDAAPAPKPEPEVEVPDELQPPPATPQAETVRDIWAGIDTSRVSQRIQKAVEDKWIGDGATAVAFQKNVVDVRGWTEQDVDLVLSALNDIRIARGASGPLVSRFDIANPATKQWLDDAYRLGQMNDAIKVHEGIVRSTTVTKDAKTGARAKLKSLQDDAAKLRKELGWTDPAKATPKPKVTNTGEAEAKSVLETIRPADKRTKKYIENLKKVKSLEYGDMPVNNLTMDHTGMVRFHGAILTDDEIAVLTRHTFEDGETFLDRWNRYLTEVQGQRNVTIGDTDLVQASLDMAMRDYDALIKTLYPVRELPPILKQIATYTRYLREKILGSWLSAPRYIGTQALGNPILMGIGGYGDPETLARMYAGTRRSWQETHRMHTLLGGDIFDTTPVMHADRIANTWGTSTAPEVRRHVSSGTDLTKDYGVVEGYFRRHNIPGARAAAGVFGDTRVIRMGGALDMAARDAVYAAAFNRRMKETITTFREQANRMLMDTGMDRREAVGAVEAFKRAHPDGVTSNQVRDFFRLYLPDGKAERLARDWQSLVNGTVGHARSEVTRVLFAGKETKADALLKSVVMFHYFMSRQYFYLMRQALHHPALLNTYVRLNDLMTEYYEAHEDQIPSWLQGYMRFALNGPGFALFLQPTSLVSIGNIFGDPDIDFGDTKTWLQENLEKAGDWLFISPLVTDALNLLGYLGDDRNIDPLRMVREVEAFNLAYNWGVRTGWIGADYRLSNEIVDVGNWVRSKVSGVLPGSEEQEYVGTIQAEQRLINNFVVEEARERGIDPETAEGQAQIDAILQDPTHPVYRAALGRYLWGETATFVARITPGIASLRPQVRAVNERGQDLLTNTTAAVRRLTNSTDEARSLRVQEQGYYAIGDSRTAEVADAVYNDVVYSENVFFDVTVDGMTYTHNEIEQMSQEDRAALGRAWLAEYGLYRTWQRTREERDVFLSQPENAEFATYKRWQSDVYDYNGGIDAYWQQLITENESARQYYEDLDEKLPPDKREQALTSKWAYLAVRGVPVGWARSQDGEFYPTSDYRSPAPKPTNDYDPVNVANQAPSPTEYVPYVSDFEEDLRNDLDNYQQYRARDEEVLQTIYQEWGMSPDTQLGVVPYKTRKAIEKEFTRRTGEYITSPSPAVEDYFRWVDSNPGRSLEDYLKWSDAQYIRGLPESFTEEQARPPEGVERDMDAYFWWAADEYRGDE